MERRPLPRSLAPRGLIYMRDTRYPQSQSFAIKFYLGPKHVRLKLAMLHIIYYDFDANRERNIWPNVISPDKHILHSVRLDALGTEKSLHFLLGFLRRPSPSVCPSAALAPARPIRCTSCTALRWCDRQIRLGIVTRRCVATCTALALLCAGPTRVQLSHNYNNNNNKNWFAAIVIQTIVCADCESICEYVAVNVCLVAPK